MLAAAALPARAQTLVVTVMDIRNSDGDIRVALYNSSENFLVDGRSTATQIRSAREGDVKFVFANLEPGTYAAAAFHDENRSGDFDTSFIGIPREGYGFSNGARAILGPPDFEEASVTLVRFIAETDLPLNY